MRQKKLFRYKFDDGIKHLESSVIVTCHRTGKQIKMYHKLAIQQIRKNYDNNYQKFIDEYQSREHKVKKKKKKKQKVVEDVDTSRPEGYRQWLLISYRVAYEQNDMEKVYKYAAAYADRYGKSISEDIS